jgi:hypothetical protein
VIVGEQYASTCWSRCRLSCACGRVVPVVIRRGLGVVRKGLRKRFCDWRLHCGGVQPFRLGNCPQQFYSRQGCKAEPSHDRKRSSMRAALVIVTVRQQGQDGFVAEQINPESSPPELKDNQCDSGQTIAKSVSALNGPFARRCVSSNC